jgi:hypothetical protein
MNTERGACLKIIQKMYIQVAQRSLILGKWMRSEIMGSNGEGPTINEGVEEFSVFLESRIFHSIWASIKLRFATCTGVPKKKTSP